MPQKLLRPIKLVEATIDAIEQVRANGPCDMWDRGCVISTLTQMGHLTVASWVINNPNCYMQLTQAFYEEVADEADQDTDDKLKNETIE